MFATLISAAALSLLAVSGARADFVVNSTDFKQCSPAHITWSGTDNPVNVLVVPLYTPCEDTLADLGDHSGKSMTWNVTLKAGTKLLISLEDSEGDEAWSRSITVDASDDMSCLSAADQKSLKAAASSAASSTATSALSFTTLSVASVPSSAASSGASSSDDGTAGALGAANAGIGPQADAAPHMAAPVVVLGALSAALAFAL
ncbi:hypothetical protein OF83DRAFT_1167239 [Amylostereum chailletii]|nr:hypothetical protein OF83DRAFT_1167239 [Amylostereum chailletii]